MSLLDIFYLFIFYSFFGWVIETIFVSIKRRHFANIGFLDGPFSPIYGFGALIVIFFVFPFRDNPFLFFSLSIITTSILEYLTSFIFEKMFKITWWNYSQEPFNFHGRICLEASLYWGVLSMVVLTFVHPIVLLITQFISLKIGYIGIIIFIIYFIIDTTDTTISIFKLKKILTQPIKLKPDLNKRVTRLINSFPNLKPRN